jgi:hypothetical protein
MDMRFPQALARLGSTAAVATSFWSHALGTDVTLRLLDQNRAPIPASVFVLSGIPVAQNGVIALSEGTRTVTVFPGKVGGAEDTALYCTATLKISGATQLVELVWRASPISAKVPECGLVTEGHFTLTLADDGSWTYRTGRPAAAPTPSNRGDPAVVELAGQIAGITRVMASSGGFDSSARPYWQGTLHTDEEWTDSALAALGAEAQVFLERARLLKRDDPELLERFASLQTRLRQTWNPMSAPGAPGASSSANAARRDLISHRLSAVEHLLELMEKLLAPP